MVKKPYYHIFNFNYSFLNNNKIEYEDRINWFKEARFGLFLHFGLYAVPARGEWVRSDEEMPEEDYLPFFIVYGW